LETRKIDILSKAITSMEKILLEMERLKKTPIKKQIDQRISEFSALGKKSSPEIFKEMCFCLLTANFNAQRSIIIQKEIGEGFIALKEEVLCKKLQAFGHRYPNARANYIVEARIYADSIKEILSKFKTDTEAREWVVEHIKGLGYKESSHFLRNIGYKNLAIIDFHIVDLLVDNGLVERPKSKCLTKKKYLEIESVLKKIADKSGLNLAELDLYLWYMETGKILK
jgi:N-glycosylase/DNA lyase